MEQDEQNIVHNKNIWFPDQFIDNRGTDDVIIATRYVFSMFRLKLYAVAVHAKPT